jgi:formamidopyrimidine-DNA glycosylase
MQGGDTARHVPHLDAGQPGLLNQLRERRLRRKPADAFRQVPVSVLVLRNPRAQTRQHRKGKAVVQRIQARGFAAGEFETEEPATRFQDAAGFGKYPFDVRHVPDAERDGVGIDGCIGDRQRLGIPAGPFNIVACIPLGASNTFREHIAVDVADEDSGLATAPPRRTCNAKGDIARAPRHIQHPPAWPGVQPLHHRILPQPMDTAAHEVVHQVVPPCHGREYLSHQALLFGLGHVAEAERCSCVWGIAHGARTYSIGRMPELPEVETVRMGLRPVLEGHRITHVETRRGDLRVPFPKQFVKRLTGREVISLRRRAKYLLADMDSGETFVIHLGMSGRMSVYAEGHPRKLGRYVYDTAPAEAVHGKHDHVVIETNAPARIVYTDHRRFGLMTLVGTKGIEQHPLFRDLGIEPLSKGFDPAYLAGALASKKTPIKSALLDQRVVAGLGNIYVCEALFYAHLSPKRLAKNVSAKSMPALVTAIKSVLDDAIKAGGSSLRDHKRVDGELGDFQHRFAVYGREGRPCPRGCGGMVKRIVQGGRSTFYCPKCQK